MALWWMENGGMSNVDRLHRQMGRIFSGWQNWPLWGQVADYPPVRVSDAGEELLLLAELPGMELDQIDISISGDMLTLKGERKPETDTNGLTPQRMERITGAFMRSLQLPQQVQADRACAHYANGVLQVRLPKAPEVAPRRIAISPAQQE